MTAQRRSVEVTSPEGTFSAYMSVPGEQNGVAIVVLQEIFGVNANIRAITDGFAEAGYAVIAPDLYWREQPGVALDPASPQDRERATELMRNLDRDHAVSDGVAALETLRNQVPGLARSAAVGYCFGGGVAYLMAVRGTVNAGVAYYGTGLHTMLSEMNGLQGQLLLHVAAEDHLCPPEAQRAIKAAATKAGDHVKIVVHAGVGHAFARVAGPAFNRESADRANAMTMELLNSLTESP